MESLKASATDLGEEGIDPYFGSGYLCKDKLVFKGSETEDSNKETDKEETDEDKDQEVNSNAEVLV